MLVPLADLAPDRLVPGDNPKTVHQLLETVDRSGVEKFDE
jgi:7,8-dihydro-6-hydroxymethylpterin-pyrophosphokinase